MLLYTHFYNIFLNALRPTFFNIFNIPFSHFLNIRKIRVKVGPKTNYFSYFQSSCSGRIVVLNNFFSLIFNQPRDKQNRACNFLLFKYNLLLTVFMQNTLSKLVDLLQYVQLQFTFCVYWEVNIWTLLGHFAFLFHLSVSKYLQ